MLTITRNPTLAASWVLKLPLLTGLLLGSIVGSTDAAAVFAVLRSSGLKLPERLQRSDGDLPDPWVDRHDHRTRRFRAGLGGGRLATWAINRINLDYPGLNSLLALAFGLVARPIAVCTSVEQLIRFFDLPLPLELAGSAAAQSLDSLLAQAAPGDASDNAHGDGLRVGVLLIQAGAEPDHVTVVTRRPGEIDRQLGWVTAFSR